METGLRAELPVLDDAAEIKLTKQELIDRFYEDGLSSYDWERYDRTDDYCWECGCEYETEDGLELFKWVRKQKWCNGRLGTFGISYHGGTQWLPATKNPEGLQAMVPVITFDDLYSGSAYYDGAKILHDLRWTVADIIPDIMERAKKSRIKVTVEPPEVYNCLEKIPLASDEAVKLYGKYYLDWMKHNTIILSVSEFS